MFFPIPSSWHKLLLVTVVLGVPGVNGLNPCLDAEDAVNYKCARGTGSMEFGKKGASPFCGYLADADLPDLQACFNAAGRTSITRIRLNWTTVKEFPVDLFNNLPNLDRLALGSTVAQTFPVGLFDDLSSVQYVFIVYCAKLTSVPVDLFRKLSNLKYLSMAVNSKLETLPAGLFKGNRKVTYLTLYASGLTALPVGTFDGLINLSTLDLTRNSLTTLPADIFAPLVSLETLKLAGDGTKSLQCIPESTASEVVTDSGSTRTRLCLCEAMSSCPEGTTCSRGTKGYTCDLPC
ncbi:unnamed protein product [Ectocarpus fasciculatus]